MKLISDIKQYLILNDFPSVNEAIAKYSKGFDEESVNVVLLDPVKERASVYLIKLSKKGQILYFLNRNTVKLV